jgi:hypothetical protein
MSNAVPARLGRRKPTVNSCEGPYAENSASARANLVTANLAWLAVNVRILN